MDSLISPHHLAAILTFLSLILIGNIPIGFYRKRFQRFSRPWARCIYIPIVASILLRRFFGLGYGIIPLSILFLFAGQFIGARIISRDFGIKRGDSDNNSKRSPIAG